jgi:hypothetical protein
MSTTIFGNGTFNFNNVNPGSAVTGTATLTAGTLGGAGSFKVTNVFHWASGTISGTGSLLIYTGALLDIPDGAPRNILGNYTLDNRGTVDRAGSNVGVLNITGSYNQARVNDVGQITGNLVVDLDGPFPNQDQISVIGTVALDGALTVHPNFTPTPGESFPIILNDGNDPVVGTFAGLPEGSTLNVNGIRFAISYIGGDGNDVTLTVPTVPDISITPVTLPEGNSGPNPFVFTVTLSNPTIQPVTVDFFTQDGTAQAGSDYTAASGTILFNPGETQKTITVTVNGDTAPENDETFVVQLANPQNATLAAPTNAVGTILDDDTPAAVQFSAPTFVVSEGAAFAVLTVTRTRSSTPLTVDFSTSPGSATADVDYQSTTGTVSFAAGQPAALLQIPIINDRIFEGDETFNVTLSNVQAPPPGGFLGSPVTTTVTIQDNDPAPVISINDATAPEGAGSMMVFTVTIPNPSSLPVTVPFSTQDGTALAGQDYVATSGTLTFAPGDTTKTVNVPLIDDAVAEPAELFFLNLGTPTNGTVGRAQATGTIPTDAGTFVFDQASYTVSEVAGGINVTVLRTLGADGDINVNYATADGAARAGADYIATSGTLTIPAGQTSAVINIPIVNDRHFEPTEDFSISLSSPSGFAALGTPSTATISILDDDPRAGTMAVPVVVNKTGMVRVFDSGTRQLKFTVNAYAAPFKGDIRVAMADVNGDNVPDIITTLGAKSSEVRVFDGVAGAPLATFNAFPVPFKGGLFVAAGDLNRDGHADIVVGAGSDVATIAAFDGASVLAGNPTTLVSPFPAFLGRMKTGVSVAVGDVNADGFADIIAGSGQGASTVRVFSGTDQSILHFFFGFPGKAKKGVVKDGLKGGVYVAAGDVNQDGAFDIIVAPRKGGGSRVNVFNGADPASQPAPIYSFAAFGNTSKPTTVAATNADGDGFDDIVTGIPQKGGPEIRIMSGANPNQNLVDFSLASDKQSASYVAGE